MIMKKILFIVGSLRRHSFNAQLAGYVEDKIKDKVEVSYLQYRDIPYMNEDLENPEPIDIRRIKKEVMEADGIWIFTPEYNGFIPGLLKNLLDWLSRRIDLQAEWNQTALANKPVTYSGAAGKSGSAKAQAQLEVLLPFILMDVVNEHTAKVQIKPEDHKTQILTLNKEEEEMIDLQINDFLSHLNVQN